MIPQNIENYQRLFRIKGLRFLINDIWVRSYKGYGVIALVRKGDYISYIPKSSMKKTLDEGLKLFNDKEKFDEYFKKFKKFQKKAIDFFEKLIHSNITKNNIEKFFELCVESIHLYKKTEYIFTNKAYLEAQRTNNLTLKQNLKKFESIKNQSRDFLNIVFLGIKSYLHKILKKISKKFSIDVKDLLQYNSKEIMELYNDKRLDKKIIKMRDQANIIFDDNNTIRAYWGKEAEKMINAFLKKPHFKTEISGTIANKGKAIGKARIILTSYDNFHKIQKIIEKMQKGDILVAETTSPELIMACKKASAIVTNQGGLMSHAAIISRELGIPCIVGTENATEIFKDGDMIEVNANEGTVKIIKNVLKINNPAITSIKHTDWYADWSGPFPLLEVSISPKIYFTALQKHFGKSFTNYLILYHKGIASARLPYEELQGFGKHLADKLNDILYAKKFTKQFKKAADNINAAIQVKPKEFLKKLNQLDEFYKSYGAYNVATKIVFNYLSQNTKQVREILQEARKYSETFYKDNAKMFSRISGLLVKQTGYPKHLVLMMTREELYTYQKTRRLPSKDTLERRHNCIGIYFDQNKVHMLQKKEVEGIESFWVENIIAKGINGTPAFKGKVTGVCRVVFDYKKANISKGEILVTGMTDPNFVPLIKKAAGIITDGGGLLSHAAIISRELKKPCIIGTKIATQVLKNGDLVEVDASKGIVRRIR